MLFKRKKKKQVKPAQERPSLTIAFCIIILVGLVMNYHIKVPEMENTSAVLATTATTIALKEKIKEDTLINNSLEDNNEIPAPTQITGLSGTLPFVRTIPAAMDNTGAKGNLRSEQLKPYELRQIFDLKEIYTVIRLNGNSKKDNGGVPTAVEKALCEAYGIQYIEINLSEVGIIKAVKIIHGYLMEGNVLIHCLHGFDRCGAMIAYHLGQLGYDKQFVINHNRGSKYLETKGEKYYKYYQFVKDDNLK